MSNTARITKAKITSLSLYVSPRSQLRHTLHVLPRSQLLFHCTYYQGHNYFTQCITRATIIKAYLKQSNSNDRTFYKYHSLVISYLLNSFHRVFCVNIQQLNLVSHKFHWPISYITHLPPPSTLSVLKRLHLLNYLWQQIKLAK